MSLLAKSWRVGELPGDGEVMGRLRREETARPTFCVGDS